MKESYQSSGIVKYKDIIKAIKDVDPCSRAIYKSRDDLSLSRLFSDVFRDSVRYNATSRGWMFYDGRVWKKDADSMNVESIMKTFIKAMSVYALQNNDQDYIKFISRYGDRTGRKRLIEDARDFNYIEQIDLDRDPNLFNCQNCVINLETGEKLGHDPSMLLSKISNVVYKAGACSDDFNRFIHEIMLNDEQKINYLQKIFGYCLTGENTQEQCYMCYGSTTRNGKSTLLDTIGYLFGDYGMNIKPESLALKDKDSRTASGDIARLDGCRFLHMSEPPKRMKFDVALLKTLLGRDKITARYMYEREFEFTPVFTLLINTNYLPVVSDDTLFSSERVKVISFDRHFKPEEQDRRLKSKLKSEENISGIFNWCLEGLLSYQHAGEILQEPDAVKQATDDYRRKSDKIGNFIDDCLKQYDGMSISIKEAYHAFESWCHDNGFGVENKSNFIEEIKSKGLYSNTATVKGKTGKGKTVRGAIKDYALIVEDPPEF